MMQERERRRATPSRINGKRCVKSLPGRRRAARGARGAGRLVPQAVSYKRLDVSKWLVTHLVEGGNGLGTRLLSVVQKMHSELIDEGTM